jgi:hypothetical protein
MKNHQKLAPTLLAAALIGTPVVASAQSTDQAQASDITAPALSDITQTVQVSGSVADLQGGTILLSSGQIVYLTPDTVIKNDASLGAAQVTVTGFQNYADGSVEATEIDAR